MAYSIKKVAGPIPVETRWDASEWRQTGIVEIATVRPEGSSHVPEVKCRLGYDAKGLYGRFRVADRFVRSVAKQFQDQVCLDSCVEFFVAPAGGRGYVNFEMNCGGVLLASWITDHRRVDDGFAAYRKLTAAEGALVHLASTLPKINEPELPGPLTWEVGFMIPFEIFKRTTGMAEVRPGTVWRANFFKCGEKTSHPHWLSWQPVLELNFHLPECFGELIFE